jgi:signal transduction histidine kinase
MSLWINDLLYSYKTAMENKIQKLETLQTKAKWLWKSYMKTNDVFKSSLYLKKRNHAMNEILKIEHEISKLLLDDLKAND